MNTGSPHTGSQYTGLQSPQGPSGGGGRGGALLVGGIAFAMVFLLIVGITVGYLVLRNSGSSGAGTSTTSASESVSTTPAETTDTTPPPETTSFEEEERCWRPTVERTSQNPSGRLRGGGLEFVPPTGFDNRSSRTNLAFTTDAQMAAALVEGSWYSSMGVAKIEWQPGVEYPGDKAASERLMSCLYGNGYIWEGTSQRTLHDQVTEAVTIAGMPGYRTSAVLKFGKHNFTKTDSTRIVIVVVDTPEGPSVFSSEVAIGVQEHEDAAVEAYDSLTGLSG